MMKIRIMAVVGLFAIYAGGAAYIRWLSAENRSLREQRNTAYADIEGLKEKAAAEKEITESLEKRHAIIEKYNADQDGGVAPVLRDVFERMRARQTK